MRNELSVLVRDARLFIQNQMRPLPHAGKEKPSLPAAPTVQREPLSPPPSLSPSPRVEEPTAVEVKALPKKLEPVKTEAMKKGDWELHAMPSADATDPQGKTPLLKKLATYTSTSEPAVTVLLMLPEENAPGRLFLENVSRAVTRSLAPASVALCQEKPVEKLVQEGRYPFILAPLSVLHKQFPNAKPHVPFKVGNTTWIPLENLDVYAHDVNSKRELWLTIQRSFQS